MTLDFSSRVFDLVGEGGRAFEVIEREVRLVEFDEGGGEAVLSLLGGWIGLEGDFEVVGGLFVIAGAIMDQPRVAVADGIKLVVGKSLVQSGEGAIVVIVLVELHTLLTIFLDVAFAGGEKGDGYREGGDEQKVGAKGSLHGQLLQRIAGVHDGIIGWGNRKA